MSDRVLTVQDACALADIVRAAQGNKPVARLFNGHVVHGTARNICRRDGCLAEATDDVRDLFLRVRSLTGLEHFWRVGVLMEELSTSTFGIEILQS
jgi:hypothetical protein